MKKFKVEFIGYSNSDGPTTENDMIIEANDLDEARKIANKWCDDNTDMCGYDWYINHIFEDRH